MLFVFTGDGEKRSAWINQATGLGNVIFTGWAKTSQLTYLSEIADIGLMAYTRDATQGLPNKIFEYLSSGLPILSSLQSETKKLLSKHSVGYTYQPGDANSFINALMPLVENEAKRKEMGNRGKLLFEQKYSAQGIELDPVRYRTFAKIHRDSLEEATWSVEADVRERIRIVTDLKFNSLIYTTLDGTALSSGNYQTAGESLTNTTTANAVDWGTALTVDNLIDAQWNVRTVSKQMFVPQRCILSGGMMSGLLKDSPLLSASEAGKATVINTGALESALGMSFEVMGDMPQDSGSTDLGFVFDENYFWIGNVPHEFEIKPNFNEATDSMEWFVYMKAAFSVGDKEAGAVLYS